MRYRLPPPGARVHPFWQVIGAIAGAGMLALFFVLGLIVLAIAAGVVAVVLIGWWLRSWWWRRRHGEPPRADGEDYIVTEYTVLERRRGPPER